MSNSIFMDACKNQVEQLGNLVDCAEEQWKINSNEVDRLFDLECLIENCIVVYDFLLTMEKKYRQVGPLLHNEVSASDSGIAIIEFLGIAVEHGVQLREQAQLFDGYSIAKLEELSEKMESVALARRNITETWPVLKDEVIKEARNEYAAGRFKNATEIINELRNRVS